VSAQDRHRSGRGRRVAGPQHHRHHVLLRFVIEAERDHQRQVTPALVVAVVEGELLLAVRGVVGRVHVHRDAPDPAPKTPAVMRDHRLRQSVRHPVQVGPARRILEARERGLRGQGPARNRIPLEQQLVNRILGQSRSVVAVRIAAGDREHPLPQEIEHPVLHLARLARVHQAGRESLRQPQALVHRLEQDGAAVRAAVLLVELRHHGLREQAAKQNTLCGSVGHGRASGFVEETGQAARFYHTGGSSPISLRE